MDIITWHNTNLKPSDGAAIAVVDKEKHVKYGLYVDEHCGIGVKQVFVYISLISSRNGEITQECVSLSEFIAWRYLPVMM
jgi:hypothetical protein